MILFIHELQLINWAIKFQRERERERCPIVPFLSKRTYAWKVKYQLPLRISFSLTSSHTGVYLRLAWAPRPRQTSARFQLNPDRQTQHIIHQSEGSSHLIMHFLRLITTYMGVCVTDRLQPLDRWIRKSKI